jgi:hypothetical protein
VESLAIVVMAILIYTLVALVVMVVTWRKTPRHPLIRAILVVLYLPAIYIGARLAYQNIPLGTRVFGGLVVFFGVINLVKLIRGSRALPPPIQQ